MESDNKNVILVAYDFTSIGDIAIENAVKMAKILQYKVCILHIINKTSRKNLKKANEPLESISQKLEKTAQSIKKEHGVDVDYMSRKGSIFRAIAEVSKEINANFLVFGTHGKKGIQFLLGSFAIKLIKSCPVPVFVAQQPAKESKFADVVFPLDMEAGSKQKVKWAIALHKQFQSKFHIYVDSYPDEFIQNRLRADLRQVRNIMDKNNIPYSENYSPKKGNFSEKTVEFAKEIKADMIMISTDPDKITWSLFGSPDERTIYNTEKIPVMCINAQDLRVIIGGL
ncbi:MAG: universal stress protein [Bacteroidetes bacterium]|nr:MAG: universal stress protein [Bacteroidota bacterium]